MKHVHRLTNVLVREVSNTAKGTAIFEEAAPTRLRKRGRGYSWSTWMFQGLGFVIERRYKASTAEWVRLEDKFGNPLSKTFYGGRFADCGRSRWPARRCTEKNYKIVLHILELFWKKREPAIQQIPKLQGSKLLCRKDEEEEAEGQRWWLFWSCSQKQERKAPVLRRNLRSNQPHNAKGKGNRGN